MCVCVCVHGVCVHVGWVNAEHEFRVWVTILGDVSCHIHFFFSIKSYLGTIWPAAALIKMSPRAAFEEIS